MTLILLVFAFVLFVIGSLALSEPHRARIVSAGLAFWVAVQLFSGWIK